MADALKLIMDDFAALTGSPMPADQNGRIAVIRIGERLEIYVEEEAQSGRIHMSAFFEVPHISDENETIVGTVSNSAWSSDLLVYKGSFNTNNNPSTNFDGTYTMLIPRTNYPPNPAGIGYGFLTNANSGLVSLAGALADGEKLTYKSTVAKNGKWPLFVQTHKSLTTYTNSYLGNLVTNKAEFIGSVYGWLTFTAKTNAPTGKVVVIKNAVNTNYNVMSVITHRLFYTAGYTNESELLTSPYVIPSTIAAKVIDPHLPTIAFDDGVTTFLQTNLTILVSNKVVVSATLQTNKINVKLTPKTGLFSGDFLYPTNVLSPTVMVKSTFLGSVLQNSSSAAGFYTRGTNAVGGAVTLEPTP